MNRATRIVYDAIIGFIILDDGNAYDILHPYPDEPHTFKVKDVKQLLREFAQDWPDAYDQDWFLYATTPSAQQTINWRQIKDKLNRHQQNYNTVRWITVNNDDFHMTEEEINAYDNFYWSLFTEMLFN